MKLLTLIIILIPLALWLLRPLIRKWIYRTLERKAEDMLRRAAGMPPRGKKQRSNNAAEEDDGSYRAGSSSSSYHTGYGYGYERHDGPIIPREYAEDVEFTEYRDYSSDTKIRTSDTGEQSIVIEKQVTDVQWEEIKDK